MHSYSDHHYYWNLSKWPMSNTYCVSQSVLCFISMISTMCRLMGSFGLAMASTASTTAWTHTHMTKWLGIDSPLPHKNEIFRSVSAWRRGTHLSQQVSQLFVDLGHEGGLRYIEQGFPVHFPSYLHLFQGSHGFLFCCLKPQCYDCWMKTLNKICTN